jgi:hypothetical protein
LLSKGLLLFSEIGFFKYAGVSGSEIKGKIIIIGVRVFNITFNNNSVTSWWSILLVEETGVPTENHRHATSH